MSDLSSAEKRKLERVLCMGDGYVLNFSNRTFSEFVYDTTGRDIYDAKYGYGSGSKANRLRGFWVEEPNHVVGKLIGELIGYAAELGCPPERAALIEECRKIAARLTQGGPVADLQALTPVTAEKDFDAVAQEVRDTIDKNRPEAGLDRLHTFVMKYLRAVCNGHGIAAGPEKPLHSLFGKYIKRLRQQGCIRSEMSDRILRSSISVLEAFNHVRNDQSLAHDNAILDYDEALLIFNNVASLIRFIRALEEKRRNHERQSRSAEAFVIADEGIPF